MTRGGRITDDGQNTHCVTSDSLAMGYRDTTSFGIRAETGNFGIVRPIARGS